MQPNFFPYFSFKTFMLKRYLHISLAFIYLVLCTGVNVYAHFCGNKLSSVSAFIDHASCCCETEATALNKCCNETFSSLKITQEHQATQGVQLISPLFLAEISPVFVPISLEKTALPSPIFSPSHAPPDEGVPIFIWNCVFTI